MSVQAGQTFVWGRHQATAQALLAACARLGLDALHVRTTDNGFIVPNEVADEAADDLVPDQPAAAAPVDAPTEEF